MPFTFQTHAQNFPKTFAKLPLTLKNLRQSSLIFKTLQNSLVDILNFAQIFGRVRVRGRRCSGDICRSSEGLGRSSVVFEKCPIIFGCLWKASGELRPPTRSGAQQ